MKRRREARTWQDIPSAGDLAGLVRCEAELVWECNTGHIRPSPHRELRSRTGQGVHARTQQEMEAFHNGAPRPPART